MKHDPMTTANAAATTVAVIYVACRVFDRTISRPFVRGGAILVPRYPVNEIEYLELDDALVLFGTDYGHDWGLVGRLVFRPLLQFLS